MVLERDKYPRDVHTFSEGVLRKKRHITVGPDDTAEEIFHKIKTWHPLDQIAIAYKLFDDRSDRLFDILGTADINKQHHSLIHKVRNQIALMSKPVKSLLQVEVDAYLNIFLNKDPLFLGQDRFIESVEEHIVVIPATIERLKFQRKKANLQKDEFDEYSNEITELKQFKRFLLAAHSRLSKLPVKISNNNLDAPQSFEDLFYNPVHSVVCLSVLSKLEPPSIDHSNTYIGKNKGIIPLWIKVLRSKNLIKPVTDKVYRDLINEKIVGLNLSNDASEFRKRYKRLDSSKTELDIKAILSQFSQEGKLGK